jgi:glycosyltransferase involved in cell wall biosynthesis
MRKLRFHLLSLAHLPQSKKYLSCAFTQKNRKLAKMLTGLGHEVFFYGSEGSDVVEYCNNNNLHFIQTHTLADIAKDYGTGDNRFEIGYNWENQDFRHDFNKPAKPSTMKFYTSCIEHINKIKKPDDFLLCSQGNYHKPIADSVKLFLTCESGIGYRGSVKDWYRAFESHHIQSYTYGSETPYGDRNGSYYDRVIPNYFDPNDIMYSDKKENYVLFIGRMIKRKGLLTAYLAAKAVGIKLIMVGQGAYINEQGHLVDNDPQEYDIPNDSDWEYRGFADVEKRKELMAHARAVIVATEYLEIFGGTHVEAMLSGTPVITTDFGVFGGNTFLHGVHGFKCNTLQDFVDAIKRAPELDSRAIRSWAEQFLMDNVAKQYDKWFQDLYNVWESTVDPNKKGWHRLT